MLLVCACVYHAYELSLVQEGRAYSYRRTISFLKSYPKKITRVSEAKNIPFVGKGTLEKVRFLSLRSFTFFFFTNLGEFAD